MTDILVDTNVFSELDRPHPDPAVLSFLERNRDFWLSVIVVHELDFGIRRMQPGARRDRYEHTLFMLMTQYHDRILPVATTEAMIAAELRARMQRLGQPQSLSDLLIAATALANDLIVVTRNVRHFQPLGVEVLNPWKEA